MDPSSRLPGAEGGGAAGELAAGGLRQFRHPGPAGGGGERGGDGPEPPRPREPIRAGPGPLAPDPRPEAPRPGRALTRTPACFHPCSSVIPIHWRRKGNHR